MMKKILVFLMLVFGVFQYVNAQEGAKFIADISYDSVYLGNIVAVEFTLKNATGKDFVAPMFKNAELVGGPNQSSSMTFINGSQTQSLTYTYFIKPMDIGNYFVEPAIIIVEGEDWFTEPIEYIVVPNPDEIVQNPNSKKESQMFDWFEPKMAPPKKKEKKKRKVYRM